MYDFYLFGKMNSRVVSPAPAAARAVTPGKADGTISVSAKQSFEFQRRMADESASSVTVFTAKWDEAYAG
ncbi:hypothetical protein LNA02_19400 [Levilactobacillus namurensis]|nr:hypothetical protein LNA02_19400 [Levilactobacillus namurensis]